jgi:hypothetical protein
MVARYLRNSRVLRILLALGLVLLGVAVRQRSYSGAASAAATASRRSSSSPTTSGSRA